MQIWSYLSSNATSIGTVVGVITLILTLIGALIKFGQYVNVQRKLQKQVDFDNYHALIERLNSPLKGQNHTWLDVQRAAVFELRHYPKYKEVTYEILSGWIQRSTQLEDTMRETLVKLGKPYK